MEEQTITYELKPLLTDEEKLKRKKNRRYKYYHDIEKPKLKQTKEQRKSDISFQADKKWKQIKDLEFDVLEKLMVYIVNHVNNIEYQEYLEGNQPDDEDIDECKSKVIIPPCILHHTKSPETCMICQEDIKQNQYKCVTDCKHKAHSHCYLRFLYEKSPYLKCPICRQLIS